MDERIVKYQEKMDKTLANLDSEFGTIRAGRANPHVLDRIMVEYYGAPTPLQQVANISVPEARMIQIQPWEGSLVKEIEKAIKEKFNLYFSVASSILFLMCETIFNPNSCDSSLSP